MSHPTPNQTVSVNAHMITTTAKALSALILLLKLVLGGMFTLICTVIFYLLCPKDRSSQKSAKPTGLEAYDSALLFAHTEREEIARTLPTIEDLANRTRALEQGDEKRASAMEEIEVFLAAVEQQSEKEASAMEEIEFFLAAVEQQESGAMEVIDSVLSEVEEQIQVSRRSSETVEAEIAEKRRRADEVMQEAHVEKVCEDLEQREYCQWEGMEAIRQRKYEKIAQRMREDSLL